MPNLYYCHSSTSSPGILRAVLSSEAGQCLLEGHPAHYAGQQFPTAAQDHADDFAVLRIFEAELDEKWQAGFYLFGANIMRIEQAVQACTTKLAR